VFRIESTFADEEVADVVDMARILYQEKSCGFSCFIVLSSFGVVILISVMSSIQAKTSYSHERDFGSSSSFFSENDIFLLLTCNN